jgi:hypothetical protein
VWFAKIPSTVISTISTKRIAHFVCYAKIWFFGVSFHRHDGAASGASPTRICHRLQTLQPAHETNPAAT